VACRVIFKDSNQLFQAGGMKARAKKLFRSWKKESRRAEIFGSGLVFATHKYKQAAA
jgi:hypothetical protein